MSFQTVSALAILLSIAPALHAQRGGGGRGGGGPQGGGRPSGGDRPGGGPSAGANRPAQIDASRATRNVPSTPIMPITNPVLPMTNPVQPVIRYGGVGYPQVVIPTTAPYRMAPDRGRPGG